MEDDQEFGLDIVTFQLPLNVKSSQFGHKKKKTLDSITAVEHSASKHELILIFLLSTPLKHRAWASAATVRCLCRVEKA